MGRMFVSIFLCNWLPVGLFRGRKEGAGNSGPWHPQELPEGLRCVELTLLGSVHDASEGSLGIGAREPHTSAGLPRGAMQGPRDGARGDRQAEVLTPQVACRSSTNTRRCAGLSETP